MDTIQFQLDKFDESITRVGIGTAGSITMVLQTVIPFVALAGNSLNIRIIGGTDVRMSPTTDYIRYILRATYQRLGIEFNIAVLKRGFYPKGGESSMLKLMGAKGIGL